MLKPKLLFACAALLGSLGPVAAQQAPATQYDAELARSLGADERGMRSYVLVVLKTGPVKVPVGLVMNEPPEVVAPRTSCT